jgi:hypothetical protein
MQSDEEQRIDAITTPNRPRPKNFLHIFLQLLGEYEAQNFFDWEGFSLEFEVNHLQGGVKDA